MKVVIQRVKSADVSVESKLVSKIGQGYLLLAGIEDTDTIEDVNYLAQKVSNLRIFSDQDGKMNLSIEKIGGEILCISQFTLIADYKKGNRPSFIRAMAPEVASELIRVFEDELRKNNITVKSGIFGADMQVQLINDGPVTIVMNSKTKD